MKVVLEGAATYAAEPLPEQAVELSAGGELNLHDLRPTVDPETGIDLSLIQENLKLSPWERILANDDTVNFCDMARDALQQRHAAA